MKHDKIEYFKKIINGGKLNHAYLFWGEAEEEKITLAKHLISLWDEKLLETATLNPDEKGAIGIEQARFAKKFLFQKPLYAPRRTILINGMEKLTDEAQNSLLKLTEEPPGNALIIGIANTPENIYPTLASRFFKFHFGKPQQDNNNAMAKLAGEFLKSKSSRGKIIEKIVEDGKEIRFFESLLILLRRDIIANWRKIKFVNERWKLMQRYQTNKKLQLRAIADCI